MKCTFFRQDFYTDKNGIRHMRLEYDRYPKTVGSLLNMMNDYEKTFKGKPLYIKFSVKNRCGKEVEYDVLKPEVKRIVTENGNKTPMIDLFDCVEDMGLETYKKLRTTRP